MEHVDDAAEEAVDEDGVDAAVARGLGALDHHEHGKHAVHRVEHRRKPPLVLGREKGQQQKRRDDEGEERLVGPDHIHVEVLVAPGDEQGEGRHEGRGHGQHVDERAHGGVAHGQGAHDARAEPERPHAQGAAPVVADDAAVHLGMLPGHILEHRLVPVDVAALKNDGQGEQGQEHERDEEGGHCHGNEIEGEVEHRAPHRAADEVAIPFLRGHGGEEPLPEHVEPRRPEAQKGAARGHEPKGPAVEVDGPDEAAPSEEVGGDGELHEEAPRGPGQEVGSQQTGEVAQGEHEGLAQEEPEDDAASLKLQGQEGKHAAPDAGRVDGEEEPVAQGGRIGLEQSIEQAAGDRPSRAAVPAFHDFLPTPVPTCSL